MRCEKCGGCWIPPKEMKTSLDRCPFCGNRVINMEAIWRIGYKHDHFYMGSLLAYLVRIYGTELYRDSHKLHNLICDLAPCDRRMMRVYSRAILEDQIPLQIYTLFLRREERLKTSLLMSESEFQTSINQISVQFADNNFYSQEFGKKIVDEFKIGIEKEWYCIFLLKDV